MIICSSSIAARGLSTRGGHIKGAIRCDPVEGPDGAQALYRDEFRSTALFVFLSEFSWYRAPMAIEQFFEAHCEHEPSMRSMHAFLLDRGYCAFWDEHDGDCKRGYVSETMEAPPCRGPGRRCPAHSGTRNNKESAKKPRNATKMDDICLVTQRV